MSTFESGAYLVTGAAGFIGARFVESCADRGIPVICVDKEDYFASRKEHAGVEFGRIVDRDELMEWLPGARAPIRAIVHMGACSKTTVTDEDYVRRVNVEYSQALWRTATELRIPLVYASSAATYGDGAHGYDDNEARIGSLEPLNLYGRSKQIFDLWALSEEKAGRYPPHWSGFKFFNVYGFGERHKGPQASVVLHAHDQVQKQGSVRLFRSHREGIADGHQRRDFIYVDDVVRVLHFALEKPIRRGIFNLGTGKARTFVELARAVFRAMGRPEKIEFIDTPAGIRGKYQYFTEAKMDRLRQEGYGEEFTSLEPGVESYLRRLSGPTSP